jgi:chemotaxis protein methyltransferase CheR
VTAVAFTDEEYRLFSEWLAAEYGLWFGPEKREILRARLEPRRAELGMPSFQELFFHLKFHPRREEERQRLLPLLTNNESYFFRERAQLEVLRSELLPTRRRKPAAPTRILSAGCAAGQEPYTLAILAREAGLITDSSAEVEITGVDLDPDALARARLGRYTDHSFRGLDDDVRERYFKRTDEGDWEVDSVLRRVVRFHQVNLAEPHWSTSIPPQDVIFCRNVLIYFSHDALRRAAQGLHDALKPGGYLFLGHAETLRRVPSPLLPERRVGAVFYRRPAS